MPTNALIHETSPYLLQHAHNPVNWHAWNDETLDLAKREDKMLLISVGYAACHWCHVMAHESFEDEEVAKVMNEHFICIKVDREERPDVDQIYMDAAYIVNGNGGWPLNALALPDGKPFFAATYFQKRQWIQLLQYFAKIYLMDREKLIRQAEQLTEGIAEHTQGIMPVQENKEMPAWHKKAISNILSMVDQKNGGLASGMKFPMPSVWEALLEYSFFKKADDGIPKVIKNTLNKMAGGGIYDQVGGGFSRYATDTLWHVPHFEKMLYDNAQLVSLYSHAWQQWKEPLYQEVVTETLDFVTRELYSPNGGFYAALDADSEGEEGKFYVWNKEEIEQILGEDADLFSRYYGITPEGNWEHQKNIPDAGLGIPFSKEAYNKKEDEFKERKKTWEQKLLGARSKRVRPHTDDKVLTSWNALMIKAWCDAYRAFGTPEYLNIAIKSTKLLLDNLSTKDGGLYRNFKNGKATIPAFLDDYAFLISALIDVYQISFEESYLQEAKRLTTYVTTYFSSEENVMFFYTDQRHSDRLIARKMEITDNVIPASNSEMAKNLFRIGQYFDLSEYQERSLRMLQKVSRDIEQNSAYHSNWIQALQWQLFQPREVAIVGNNWQPLLTKMQSHYLPGVCWSGGSEVSELPLLQDRLVPGKTMIYVCKNKACQLPTEDVEVAMGQVLKRQ